MKKLEAFFVITISLVLIFSFQEALAAEPNGSICRSDSDCISGYCRLAEEGVKRCVACRTKNQSCAGYDSPIPCCSGLVCKDSLCRAIGYVAPEPGTCDYYCEDPETREPPEGTICICNPLSSQTFEEVISSIINFIFNISIVVAPLMIVWAGGLYITSSGDEKKITTAKNIIVYTLSGLAIVLLSTGFVAIIRQILGG